MAHPYNTFTEWQEHYTKDPSILTTDRSFGFLHHALKTATSRQPQSRLCDVVVPRAAELVASDEGCRVLTLLARYGTKTTVNNVVSALESVDIGNLMTLRHGCVLCRAMVERALGIFEPRLDFLRSGAVTASTLPVVGALLSTGAWSAVDDDFSSKVVALMASPRQRDIAASVDFLSAVAESQAPLIERFAALAFDLRVIPRYESLVKMLEVVEGGLLHAIVEWARHTGVREMALTVNGNAVLALLCRRCNDEDGYMIAESILRDVASELINRKDAPLLLRCLHEITVRFSARFDGHRLLLKGASAHYLKVTTNASDSTRERIRAAIHNAKRQRNNE